MAKVYDPILCMMVEQPATKVRDKAGEMWFLIVNGKTIKAFEKWGAPVAEAKKYMKENNIPGVGILKRLGRSGEYTITARDGNTARTVDDAAADFNKMLKTLSDLKAMVRKYSRKIDSNYFFNVIGQMEDKIQYYVNNASRGWYD